MTTFLLGPNFVLGASTVLVAYLLYRSRPVPRPVAVLGLAGGPLIFASATAVLFGAHEQLSVWGSLAGLPVFAWEPSLAAWLTVKGFRPEAVTDVAAEAPAEVRGAGVGAVASGRLQ
ncbi:DUF4386 domain-containing protein [Streptomyces sp. NPDC007369]|uniref:DUF4386 domain-containing protein n=1 Tax=Streptomyces sp. NPDC007369 TaxID=3154589 RepID=UPI0033F36DC2